MLTVGVGLHSTLVVAAEPCSARLLYLQERSAAAVISIAQRATDEILLVPGYLGASAGV